MQQRSALLLAIVALAALYVSAATTNNLFSFGDNTYGQLGINTTTPADTLQPIDNEAFIGDPAFEVFSTHGNFSVAISRINRNIYYWGQNPLNANDHILTPRELRTEYQRQSIAVEHLAAGRAHILISEGPIAYALGTNTNGQLGDGTFISSGRTYPVVKVAYNNTSPVIELAAGVDHSCLLNQDNDLYCWGSNQYGQLGVNLTVSSTPIKVMSGVTSVSAGEYHTVVIADSKVYAFGRNHKGQLCTGDSSDVFSPTMINTSPSNANAVLASAENTYIIRDLDNHINCCGANDKGQCATGSLLPATITTPVIAATSCLNGTLMQHDNKMLIAASGARVIAVSTNERICAWGATPQMSSPPASTDVLVLDYSSGGTVLGTAPTVENVATGLGYSLVSTSAPFYVQRNYKYLANSSTTIEILGEDFPILPTVTFNPSSIVCLTPVATASRITCDVAGPFPPALVTVVVSGGGYTSAPVPIALTLTNSAPKIIQNIMAIECDASAVVIRGTNIALDQSELQVNLTSELGVVSGQCDTIRPLGVGAFECAFGTFSPDTGLLYAQVRNIPLGLDSGERVLVGEVTGCCTSIMKSANLCCLLMVVVLH
jgi:alpha-tubulin suppressor-like RCC1 family protein